jgi:hypothetical protein
MNHSMMIRAEWNNLQPLIFFITWMMVFVGLSFAIRPIAFTLGWVRNNSISNCNLNCSSRQFLNSVVPVSVSFVYQIFVLFAISLAVLAVSGKMLFSESWNVAMTEIVSTAIGAVFLSTFIGGHGFSRLFAGVGSSLFAVIWVGIETFAVKSSLILIPFSNSRWASFLVIFSSPITSAQAAIAMISVWFTLVLSKLVYVFNKTASRTPLCHVHSLFDKCLNIPIGGFNLLQFFKEAKIFHSRLCGQTGKLKAKFFFAYDWVGGGIKHGESPFEKNPPCDGDKISPAYFCVTAQRWVRAACVFSAHLRLALWGKLFLLGRLFFFGWHLLLDKIMRFGRVLQIVFERAQHFRIQRAAIVCRAFLHGFVQLFFGEANKGSKHIVMLSLYYHLVNLPLGEV